MFRFVAILCPISTYFFNWSSRQAEKDAACQEKIFDVRLGNYYTPRPSGTHILQIYWIYETAIALTSRRNVSSLAGGPRVWYIHDANVLEHTQHSNPQGPRIAWKYLKKSGKSKWWLCFSFSSSHRHVHSHYITVGLWL